MTEGARVISHTLHVSGHTVDALLEASEHRLSCWPGRTLSHAQSRSTPWASRKDPGSSSLQLSSHTLHVSGHTCLASVPTSQSNGTRCGRASNQMHGSRESKKGTSNVPVGSSSHNWATGADVAGRRPPLDTGAAVSIALDTGAVVSIALDTGAVVSIALDTGGEVSIALDTGGEVSIALDTGAAVSIALDTGAAVSIALETGAAVSIALDTGAKVSGRNPPFFTLVDSIVGMGDGGIDRSNDGAGDGSAEPMGRGG